MMRPVTLTQYLLIIATLVSLSLVGCRKDVIVQDIVPQQVKIILKNNTRDSSLLYALNKFPEIWLIEYYQYCYARYIPDINQSDTSYLAEVEKRPYVKNIITSGFVLDATGQRLKFSVNLTNMHYRSNQEDWIALIDSLGFKAYYTEPDSPFIIAYIPIGKELEMSEQIRKLSCVQSANPILYSKTIKENESFYNFFINHF